MLCICSVAAVPGDMGRASSPLLWEAPGPGDGEGEVVRMEAGEEVAVPEVGEEPEGGEFGRGGAYGAR